MNNGMLLKEISSPGNVQCGHIRLNNGQLMPRLGMGTWYLGEFMKTRGEEIEALRTGLDIGMNLIDTAEMYGNGLSEQLIGQVISGYDREKIFLVSKVCPHHAGREKIWRSIRHSLRFLRTDYLDLYLLHWRGMISLQETVECMEELVEKGMIRAWGVSNFDLADMQELMEVPNGKNCAVNQVLYHLGSRGIEYKLLPWQKQHNIPLMAYCPLAQAGKLKQELLKDQILKTVAEKYHISVMQLLLAFVLQQENVIAIPRSRDKKHILENRAAYDIKLEAEDLEKLNTRFPAPTWKVPLEIV